MSRVTDARARRASAVRHHGESSREARDAKQELAEALLEQQILESRPLIGQAARNTLARVLVTGQPRDDIVRG